MISATSILMVDIATGLLLGGLLLGLLWVIEIVFVKKKRNKKAYWYSVRCWIGFVFGFYLCFFGGSVGDKVFGFIVSMYSPVLDWYQQQKLMRRKKRTRRSNVRRSSQAIRHVRVP